MSSTNNNVITRFAPSPTGRLHMGHAYSAVLAHDYARTHQGQFLLRIEDIDQGRCRSVFVDGIINDLKWLGLDWDGDVVFQSHRTDLYRHALDTLIDAGLVYRCWCTRAEIAALASAPHDGEAIVYPGTCKGREAADGNLPFCWRLDVARASRESEGGRGWEEVSSGFQWAQPLTQGDVVIARKDAETSYHLAVTVDDADQGVTDIIRGRDLFMATHIHCLLQDRLGLSTPRYHHHPLLCDEHGQRLAKRHNSPTIASLRDAGYSPKQVTDSLRSGPFLVGIQTETSKV